MSTHCEFCLVGNRVVQLRTTFLNYSTGEWELDEQVLICNKCDDNVHEILTKLGKCRKDGETTMQLLNRLADASHSFA
jgi:hypothetical protein